MSLKIAVYVSWVLVSAVVSYVIDCFFPGSFIIVLLFLSLAPLGGGSISSGDFDE